MSILSQSAEKLIYSIKKAALLLLLILYSSNLSAQYTPGESVFDQEGYVEYIPGDLPIIISVPHGGYLEPVNIPDRNCSGCVYVRDSYTQELARSMNEAFFDQMGGYPHVIINLLRRTKFDANRDIGDAADGNATVEQSWDNYHEFIDIAKEKVNMDFGRGLFIDLHGHGHDIQRLELGYLLSRSELELTDTQLDQNALIQESSIRTLVDDNLNEYTHSELLRGRFALGTIVEKKGYPSVPSRFDTFPLSGEAYFSGGYNTLRHGSIEGGAIDAIQIECNQDVRFEEPLRNQFAIELTEAINQYYDVHYDEDYLPENFVTSTKEMVESPVQIYPNPASEYLMLEGVPLSTGYAIHDYLGRAVMDGIWSNEPIDLNMLELGSYILQLQDSRRSTLKLYIIRDN